MEYTLSLTVPARLQVLPASVVFQMLLGDVLVAEEGVAEVILARGFALGVEDFSLIADHPDRLGEAVIRHHLVQVVG